MTRGLFTASVVVTVALSIGPVSSGLMNFRASDARTSSKATTDHLTLAAQTGSQVPPPGATQPSDPRTVTPDPTTERPRLTLVPRNRKLESRLRPLLPKDMTVREAAAGFGDQSQFVSAVHVSRNLGIPFASLKSKIVDERLTLGQAIQELRPDADVWRELTRARDLTAKDIY